MTTQTIKVLRVVAKREGFRRAGFVFGSQARELPLDTLSASQRAAIERDPMLLVTETEVQVQAQAEDDAQVMDTGANPDQGAADTTGDGASGSDPKPNPTSVAGRKRK